MVRYNVAILGCGAIFSRHLSAIQNNPEHFKLVGLYDPVNELQTKYTKELDIKAYSSEDEAYLDPAVNCIVILTPSNLHYKQSITAMTNKKHVIVEKPATFLSHELDDLNSLAKKQGVEIFSVLQVRLNPAVMIVKKALESGLLGQVRSVSLVQRWQRPLSYFSGWRGTQETGGGILREFGIHYLDILQFLVGVPKVSHANFFNTKFLETDVSDTAYGLLDFKTFGGSFEVSIAAEPKNLECTLSIMTDKGFVKLGGRSLDEIITIELGDEADLQQFNSIKDKINNQQRVNVALPGASPYHPELYRQIVINPQRFSLEETYNVIKLVEQAYKFQ
jgi:UDP-N-acetyl-2-amino-2-deoxyglucuronate dehydrogenase